MNLSYLKARAPTWYTFVSGGFSLLRGTSTLLFHFYPPLDQAFPATTRMIPEHSLMHIMTGLLAVAALRWGGPRGAWWFALLFGIYYTALGLIGWITNQTFGLGLFPFDHPIHLLIGVLGLLAAALGYHEDLSPKRMPT